MKYCYKVQGGSFQGCNVRIRAAIAEWVSLEVSPSRVRQIAEIVIPADVQFWVKRRHFSQVPRMGSVGFIMQAEHAQPARVRLPLAMPTG